MADHKHVDIKDNSVARVLKEVSDQLTCPICYQLYKSPKYLTCYHSCCKECLDKLQKDSNVVCPECREVTALCEGGVKELPNNFFIARLVDELTLKCRVNHEEKCDQCVRGATVEVFCSDCTLLLCCYCHEHHKHDRQCHNHNTIYLTEISPSIVLQPKVASMLCPEHDNELNYYCESCKELVCLYCTTKKHSSHEHEVVKKVAEKHRRDLESVVAPLDTMVDNLLLTRQQAGDVIKGIELQCEYTSKGIDQCYNELYQKLQHQKDVLMKELGSALLQRKKMALARVEQIDCVHAQLVSIKELNNTLTSSCDQEVLLVEQEVVAHVKEITKQYTEVVAMPSESVTIKFAASDNIPFPQFGQMFISSNINPLNSEITGLPNCTLVGKQVELHVIARDHDDHCFCMGADDITVQIKSGEGISDLKLENDDNGAYTGSFLPQSSGQVTVSVTVKGQHIRGSPHVVTVGRNYLAIDGASSVVNDGMEHPWGIAFSKDGTWAVTDCTISCVYIFGSDDRLVRKFSGSDKAQLCNPCGIAFDGSNHLYVADCSCYGVKKFDILGNFLFFFSIETAEIENPLGVMTHDNKVYVTCSGSVMVFDTNGLLCCKIGCGVLSRSPYDVAISNDNQLLVSDSGFHCIFTFTLHGKYVSKFGTQGAGDRELNSPHGLTVDADGFILVTDYNHRVSVFDHEGNWMHHFGSKGFDSGHFKFPHGIAVSPNGNRVFVSDYSNKRVQIFEITK